MRQRHGTALEELSEQLEQAKRVTHFFTAYNPKHSQTKHNTATLNRKAEIVKRIKKIKKTLSQLHIAKTLTLN